MYYFCANDTNSKIFIIDQISYTETFNELLELRAPLFFSHYAMKPC